MKSIIYQKTYSMIDTFVDTVSQTSDTVPPLSFDDFMNKANDVQLEYIAEREIEVQSFINTAIHISNVFQLDLTVEKDDECVSATFTVESGPCPESLKPLFILADRYFFTVRKDYRLILSLDYYTHRVYRNGRLIAPINWEDIL